KVHAVTVVNPEAQTVGSVGKFAFGSTRYTCEAPPPPTKFEIRSSVPTYSIPSGPWAMQVGVESRSAPPASFGMYAITRRLPSPMTSLIVLAPASATKVRIRSPSRLLVTRTAYGLESGKSSGNSDAWSDVHWYIWSPTSDLEV